MTTADVEARKMALLKAIESGNVAEVKDMLTDEDLFMNEGNDSLFHRVCSSGCEIGSKRTEMLELFVARGADVNTKNAEGDQPLHLCVDTRDVDSVDFLIRKGVNVDELGKHETMATTRAARNGDREMLRFLFENNASVNTKDSFGRMVLHQIFCLPPLIVAEDTGDIVDILLQNGCDLTAEDNDQNQPLHYAALSGCTEGVAHLIEKGVEIDPLNKDRQSPLAKAVWRGEIDTMTQLINGEAHINKIDAHCNSIINNACDSRAIFWDPITNDVDSSAEGCYTKEQKIIKDNKELCIKKLITEKEMDINFPNIIGMSPLMNASKAGMVSVVKALLLSKADVFKRDINGRSALHHVFRENTNTDYEIREIVEVLRQYKAKENQLDKFGNAPLHYAVMYPPRIDDQGEFITNEKSTDQTRLEYLMDKRGGMFKLLENGGDPNIAGRGGNTALHLACKYDNSEKFDAVRILRYFKADNSIVNNVGQSALNLAQQTGKQDLIDALTKNLDLLAPENKQDTCCTIL